MTRMLGSPEARAARGEGMFEALETRFRRVETKLDALTIAVGRLPDRWTLFGLLFALAVVLLAAQANMFSALQSGLSAVSTGIAARQEAQPAPAPQIIIVLVPTAMAPVPNPPR